ncbi:MAG: hypothetical protein HC822_09185 [Oscillochloris sp.]|nr:hypothetical protein [Oscillochloris sp.]
MQAALIPLLEDREFAVLPVIRVNAGAAGSGANRYLRSAILALEEGFPAAEQLPVEDLESLDLTAYLSRRIPPDEDALLIFDQFEEILTLDPTDITAKHAFFEAIGRTLRERRYWALFSMREDYVAALEPYLRHMPNRLDVRFRLDLLSVEGARQALHEPPREVGVTFEANAVNRLIDDLRRVNVQRPDGTIEEQLGPHVEPVQLQVLGLRIWSGLAPDATTISNADVAAAGDVNQALGDYYADCVKAVAVNGVSERTVRTWFDRELITPQGVRGQVLQGQGTSAGLENTAIRALVDAYLVRAEPRRGATWFELAHDRLITPVRAGNSAWFAANLSTLQRQADLWDRQGRPNGLLLRGDTLQEAERWAAANSAMLTPVEQDFLELCRQAKRQAERIRNLAIGATILAIAASLAFVTALWFFNRAEEQRRLAEQNARLSRSRELAAAAVNSLPTDPQHSLLLSLAAIDTTQAAGEPVTPEAQQALYQAVQLNRLERELRGHTAGLRAVAYSPDGTTIATTGAMVRCGSGMRPTAARMRCLKVTPTRCML